MTFTDLTGKVGVVTCTSLPSTRTRASYVRLLTWKLIPKVRVNDIAIGVGRTRWKASRHSDSTIDAACSARRRSFPSNSLPTEDYVNASIYLAGDSAAMTGEGTRDSRLG